jgi:hypothetical protein
MRRQSEANYWNIRDCLKGSGKTEAELVEPARISQARVNMIKNGSFRPTPEAAARLEVVTGIPLRNQAALADSISGAIETPSIMIRICAFMSYRLLPAALFR